MKSSGAGGEIIQVQGGHIIRSTGRKDRHSKVYTAKGPRDRRVRLSAHTAIQFYDVQDRLGYDRPSKAVDWLINKAKSAIDKLAELPAWHPNAANTSTADMNADQNGNNSTEMAIQEQSDTLGYNNSFQLQRQLAENPNNDSSSFIPQPLDSAAMADTMRSFFPTSSAASSMNFQSYPHEIISRTTNPSEDLGLSLHSYHESSLLHAAQSQGQSTQVATNDHQAFLAAAGGYDNSMVAWSSEGVRGGYMFHSLPLHQQQQQQQQQGGAEALLGHHGSAFSQRGTLQSSFIPSIRAWENFSADHHKAQDSIFSGRFSSDGLPVFYIPEQFRGHDGHGGGVSHRPSSSSPSSHQ